MPQSSLLISTGNLSQGVLAGKTVVISGAGSGIGFEAARALLWLGAKVVIAEINKEAGRQAALNLSREFSERSERSESSVLFVHTDIGDERSIERMAREAERAFGKVDGVLNNATVAPLGGVQDVEIKTWDASYRVNLRGPVLLARRFLPGMVRRKTGVFACVSSTGSAYMGAYETYKAAQVHLARTINDEVEGSGVIAYTIGPGFAPTRTAAGAIPKLAKLMGKPTEELQLSIKGALISVEAAGAGFAASIALAERYRGMEISSPQALIDAGIQFQRESRPEEGNALSAEQFEGALALCRQVRATLAEQSAGWKERSVFEQQWMLRTFRQYAKMPAEEWLTTLDQMESCLAAQDSSSLLSVHLPLGGLAGFYAYLHQMAKGYGKDAAQREEHLRIVRGWQDEVEQLGTLIGK